MTEFKYYLNAADSAVAQTEVGLSGIVKNIRIFSAVQVNIAADAKFGIDIIPKGFTMADSAAIHKVSKFSWLLYTNIIVAVVDPHFMTIFPYCYKTNFYVDKTDQIGFFNNNGGTVSVYVTLDIVPVSDKTRLALSQRYED